MKKAKNKYAIDSLNRMVIRRRRKTIVADGRFDIGKNNALIYWLNEPQGWRREHCLAPKIKFKGKWKLDRNYDLEFILEETKEQYKNDRLLLRGEIISVDSDKLIFQIQSRDKDGQSHIQLLKLSGVWQTDEFNRLTFEVTRKEEPDILVLSGIWQVNQNQQIIYNYEKAYLKRKNKITNTLTFSGFWEINKHNRLTYILSHELNSCFDFRVQLESPDLYPKEGAIKYRIGIGIKGEKSSKIRLIPIYGAWKFSRKFGLNFEVDYGNGRVEAMEFGADVHLTGNNTISFALTNRSGESLGMRVIFTYRFLKKMDAELFLKLKKFQSESGIEAGVRIPF